MQRISLSQIHVYPVKSLGGFRVECWPVDRKGLRHDRKWMLIDANGRFLTQRSLPKMALIQTQIVGEKLVLTAPERSPLSIPLHPSDGEPVEADIWNDRCSARCVGRNADRWLGDFLDTDCRLIYHPDDAVRPVDPSYARTEDQTAFSDGFPFLIVSEASLHALNRAMEIGLPIERFRPNLVVVGCDAYAEDSWREIRIGAIDFRLPKPCSRCAIPTIDPDTAERGKEPLRTLNRLRKWNNQVWFGQNALHDDIGELTVGSAVTIRSIGPARPPLP